MALQEKDWAEIEAIAPKVVEDCKAYLMKRYWKGWKQKMNELNRVIEFLRTKGIGIRISGWNGVWKYKIWKNEKLIENRIDLTEQEASINPIKVAFKVLEHQDT